VVLHSCTGDFALPSRHFAHIPSRRREREYARMLVLVRVFCGPSERTTARSSIFPSLPPRDALALAWRGRLTRWLALFMQHATTPDALDATPYGVLSHKKRCCNLNIVRIEKYTMPGDLLDSHKRRPSMPSMPWSPSGFSGVGYFGEWWASQTPCPPFSSNSWDRGLERPRGG
jgi:hypothetical protein